MTDDIQITEAMVRAASKAAPGLNEWQIVRMLKAGLPYRRDTIKAAFLIAPSLRMADVDDMLDAAVAAMSEQ